ncbi:MAG: class I SAM-dependent methyltransferase [Acidimicrobiales bacterium]|jgi:SAM-dependent methyltransferase
MVNDFFSDGSPYLSHPLLTAERTSAEIDQLERLIGSISGRVLDVGCGFGRHSIELASRGADITGIDRSVAMISAARERSIAAGQFADFSCVAARDLREVGRYDLAICLFGTFGQLANATSEDTLHLDMLGQIKQALRPSAKLVIELPDRDRMVAKLVEQEQFGTAAVTRQFNTRTSIMTERAELETGAIYVQRCRLFDVTELVDLVHDSGLEVHQVMDRGLAPESESLMTLVATRTSN